MRKDGPLKMRAIRFPEKLWWKILARASEDTSGETTASDVVRDVMSEYVETVKLPMPRKRPLTKTE